MGNTKAPKIKDWATGKGEWPRYIKDASEREAHITKVMKGRRYDDPGMEIKFKPGGEG